MTARPMTAKQREALTAMAKAELVLYSQGYGAGSGYALIVKGEGTGTRFTRPQVRALEERGLISINRGDLLGKPSTPLTVTDAGREALATVQRPSKRTKVSIPAIRPGFDAETIPACVVEVERDTGRVFLNDRFIGTVSKGENTAQVGGTAKRGTANYFAGVTAWRAWRPEHAPHSHREDFDGDRYPAHYKRNSRKGAIAYLLTVAHGQPTAYYSWA